MNRDFIAGLLNFFVWGLGYIYKKEYVLGILWLFAFILIHLPMFYLGLAYYQSTVEGTALFMGHVLISGILLYMGWRKEARSDRCWRNVVRNWKPFLVGTIAAGLLSEFANELLVSRWWVYHPPWTLFGMFGTIVGLPLVFGWLVMVLLALLITYLIEQVWPKVSVFPAWLASWVIIGFAFETFNTLVWRTWHYQPNTIWTIFPVPGLDYGILVPIVGYGGTGLFTYLGYMFFKGMFK